MAAADQQVEFSLNVVAIKESSKVLYVAVDSDFTDVLLSFLTLPLGTILRLLIKHYGNNAPVLGSLNSLYAGLLNMDSRNFWTEAGKLMLLNPRSSSEVKCSRLKLRIDDTPPIQYFTCRNWKCASMYYSANCLCPVPTNTMIRRDHKVEAQSGDKSVFTVQTSSLILTDDLQILANTSASIFRILKQYGIEDTSVLVERTLIFGLKEMMELLKRSLVSKTPITDIILCNIPAAATLSKRKRSFALHTYEPNSLPQIDQVGKNSSPEQYSKKIAVKVLVQKSTNKVLFAQACQDFVDFLFSLLAIPLGRVQILLGNNTNCLGSISNLYRSISNQESAKYMKSTISALLEPPLPPYYLSSHQIFSLNQQASPAIHRRHESGRSADQMKIIDPKGHDSFVKGPTMFMVTDDLVVSSTPPSTYIISTLSQMKIPVSDVEEHELDIGLEEALSILKASLTSTCALTNGLKPFLKRHHPKREHC